MITPINTTSETPRTWREYSYSPTTTLQDHISSEMGKVNESLEEVIADVNKTTEGWNERFDRMEAKLDAALARINYWQGVMDTIRAGGQAPVVEVTWT